MLMWTWAGHVAAAKVEVFRSVCFPHFAHKLEYISVFVANQIAVAKRTVHRELWRLAFSEAMTKPTTLPLMWMCVQKGKNTESKFRWHAAATSAAARNAFASTPIHSTHYTRDADFIGSFVTFRYTGIFSINVLKCRTHKYCMRNTFTYAMRVYDEPEPRIVCDVAKNGIA